MRRIFGALIIIIGSMLMLAGTATAHDITSASAVCTSPNSAEFSFTFANFGSESRFVKVYIGGVLIGDFEAQTGDGVHKFTITNIDTGNGNQANVQFHFESDAVVNLSHDISVDFTACGATTTGATTTAATTTTACEGDEGCETTTTATTIATTTTATTIATTTTAQQTTTTVSVTTTVPVTNPCPGSGCPQTTPPTTAATTTLGTTTTTAGSTTVAPSTTVADTTAADQTLAPTPAPEIEPTMPVTGSETTPMLVFGALLIAAGGGLTLIRKRS